MPLNIAVDPKDPLPLYAQLERAIRVGIVTGNIKPGQQLPTVRQLAVDLRVNANTVARVYLALERDGVLTTRRGVGTFVAEGVPQKTNAPHRERRLRQAIDRFLTEAISLGYKPREAVRALARRVREGE
jgi:GntR family transcriptional regulator